MNQRGSWGSAERGGSSSGRRGSGEGRARKSGSSYRVIRSSRGGRFGEGPVRGGRTRASRRPVVCTTRPGPRGFGARGEASGAGNRPRLLRHRESQRAGSRHTPSRHQPIGSAASGAEGRQRTFSYLPLTIAPLPREKERTCPSTTAPPPFPCRGIGNRWAGGVDSHAGVPDGLPSL